MSVLTSSVEAAQLTSIEDVELLTPVGTPGSLGGVVSGASTVMGAEVLLSALALFASSTASTWYVWVLRAARPVSV